VSADAGFLVSTAEDRRHTIGKISERDRPLCDFVHATASIRDDGAFMHECNQTCAIAMCQKQ